MDSSPDQIIKEISVFIRAYKDGRCEKLTGTDTVPAGIDPTTGVHSKDVVISPQTPLSVRLYISKTTDSTTKRLPPFNFFHGGGFVIESAASPVYHNFLNLITAESNVVVVSVDYRTAPEHPVPSCFHDSWEAVKWAGQHVDRNGPDPSLNEYPDYEKMFFTGDSAGGNIAHHMAIRFGSENSGMGLNLQRFELDHPWWVFLEEAWKLAWPETSGSDDPLINPAFEPKVSDLGCSRILVYVTEKDALKDRDCIIRIFWVKMVGHETEVIEDEGVDHVYFLNSPSADAVCTMRKRICTFINGN